jgi:ATP:corrinoid adenosyltransferase
MDAAHARQIFVGDDGQLARFLRQVCTQAACDSTPLFLARFLTDLGPGELASEFQSSPWIALRQYGGSCFVNAAPPLADALRAETGLAEAEAAVHSGKYRIVVLCQVLDAVGAGLLTSEDLAALVDACPAHVQLILTGHSLPPTVTVTSQFTVCLSVYAPVSH